MKVALGADHAGFALKDALKQTLDALGIEHYDFGTTSNESVDYPDFAHAVAEGVATGRFDRGILVCGTGIGMAIAANKVPGIRAAVVADEEAARLSREHNDANVLTLGARVTPADRAQAIVGAFLCTSFEGGRHRRRVEKIHKLESAPGSSRPVGAALPPSHKATADHRSLGGGGHGGPESARTT